MLRIISERNVNQALASGLLWLQNRGDKEESRGGTVIVAKEPVITRYLRPCERVLFSPMRDANPFFHFMEGLWMLAGHNDVEWPTQFNSTFGQFSDDGKTFHGAYGYRWRQYFGYDQLDVLITELRSNPTTRRAVLAMWDGGCWGEEEGSVGDLNTAIKGGKDVPCNTHAYFRVHEGVLDMQINNRSNDIIWGAYGANAVHMSMMMEYVARCVGVEMGKMYQSSFNFHAYTDRFPLDDFAAMARDAIDHDYYDAQRASPYPLLRTDKETWDADLQNFMEWSRVAEPGHPPQFEDGFFNGVAAPMRLAWAAHKTKDYRTALHHGNDIIALDWRLACVQWLERRRLRHDQKEQGIA